MFMLDTDICSYILRERPVSVLEKFKRIDASGLCISVITQAELHYGVARSASRKVNRAIVNDFTTRLLVLDWNSAAAERYAVLRAELEAAEKPIGNMAIMIAAHALSINATVVTNNIRHFKIVPGLKTANWV